MTNDTEVLDSSAACQRRTELDSSFHNPIGQVRIKLGVPIAFLITSTKYCTSAYKTLIPDILMMINLKNSYPQL